jgi:hypothetical protein
MALRGIPYAIIGGMAVQRWGTPRLTQDVDLTIMLVPGEERPILEEIAAAFPARTQNPVEFALRHRMLLLRVPNAADVDLSLGLPGYEDEVIARAVEYNLGRGRKVRLCSAEDLIIHKAVAGRPQDLLDIEGILLRQQEHLDVSYIRNWRKVFAELLGTDDVIRRFETQWGQLNPGHRAHQP